MWKYHLQVGGTSNFFEWMDSFTMTEICTLYALDGIIPIPNHWEIAAYQIHVGSEGAISPDKAYPNDKTIFQPDEDQQKAIAEKLKRLKAEKKKKKDK